MNYFRKNRGKIKTSTRIDSATKSGNSWSLETKTEEISVEVIVNAAGAWGDQVASRAGVEPIGLQPKRRTAFTVNSNEPDLQEWGMIADIDLRFYCKPDGKQLLCSLAEENPSEPCDAKHDEADVDRVAIEKQQFLEIVQEAREQGEIEVGILDVFRRSKSKFRLLSAEETDAMVECAREKL